MGRIGSFFKKIGRGIAKGVKWVVHKGIDVGKKIVDNPIVKTAATAIGGAFGVPPPATLGALTAASKGLGIAQNIRDRLSGNGGGGGDG